MTVAQYIDKVNTRFKSGISTEHSYRGDLQHLLESLVTDVQVTNEPTRIDCGAPDYIITKNAIPVGYIEAKDIGIDLKSKSLREQFDRYKASLNNLIFTDYLDFHLYIDGEFKASVQIGRIEGNKVIPLPEHFAAFEALIKDFCIHVGQTIRSAKKLAEMMAGKAKMLALVIEKAIEADERENENLAFQAANNTLREQLKAFQNILIHDITTKEFADIYAQTVAYGMFAARLHDPDLRTFSRVEAAEQIPKSNPFLRKLFQYVAGYDLDDRIKWIVDALADIFRATDVRALVTSFGKATKQHDPIIHFYETFLSEYDPKLRKARGVWYTPEPVVSFIVRAVDEILKTEFNLPQGLADNSKTRIKVDVNGKKVEQEVHRVQILDPATGTGTFLAEVIRQVHKNFEGQQGIWSKYVENHLIPRLNGFELLMASYAMAHLQLDLLLTETGYKPAKDQRFRVYLTNSLEEYHPQTGTLFANWLSAEANEANLIKRDTPVMCVIGNPPYSGISSNNGEWIGKLIDDYKYVDGEYFNERKHWLNDDYVKFIRYGQHFIEKNKSGILAFINPHGFLENPTFRGMRWNLLQSFDKIYTIDLHGNSTKKETAPDGSPDQNVFDIMQGVSVNLFVKTGKKKAKALSKVFHWDVFGKREAKYEFLLSKSIEAITFSELKPQKPNFFFVPVDLGIEEAYQKGFYVGKLFVKQSMGVTTARDHFVVDIDQTALLQRIQEFSDVENSDALIRSKYFGVKSKGKYLPGDTRGWKLAKARTEIRNDKHGDFIQRISYRPFDVRYIYYSKKMVDWGREDVMQNLIEDNVALVCVKIGRAVSAHNFFVANCLVDKSLTSSLDNSNVFPLYLTQNDSRQTEITGRLGRIPNFNMEIVNAITTRLNLRFTDEKVEQPNTFAPIDLLDYVYAVLYSTSYREKYKEFLKIDFPRVPYPQSIETFWQLSKLGSELRQIHLLESSKLEPFITSYPQDGDNTVTRKIVSGDYEIADIENQTGRVWINDAQYFANVPLSAWDFHIGGYQPAQKWLKDRKGRELNYEDILHYQRIIAALVETDRIMKEIDKVIVI